MAHLKRILPALGSLTEKGVFPHSSSGGQTLCHTFGLLRPEGLIVNSAASQSYQTVSETAGILLMCLPRVQYRIPS